MLPREERRRIAYRMLQRHIPKSVIARQLGVAHKTVWMWEKRRASEGPLSWKYHLHLGSKRRLAPRDQRALLAILRKGARARGYSTARWTLKRAVEVIRKQCGIQYTLSGVWRMLRALGRSAQVPPRIALERDGRHIRHWVKVQWPAIAERAVRRKATVVSEEKWPAAGRAGPRVQPGRGTAAPRGIRRTHLAPVAKRSRDPRGRSNSREHTVGHEVLADVRGTESAFTLTCIAVRRKSGIRVAILHGR